MDAYTRIHAPHRDDNESERQVMSEHTPTTAEVRDYFTHGQFSDVPEPEGVARFNRWLTKHDAEHAAATSRLLVHFDDDHEECARELAAAVAASRAAYNRGYSDAERERQRAGDGMGLT